jgi:hypothetical protein
MRSRKELSIYSYSNFWLLLLHILKRFPMSMNPSWVYSRTPGIDYRVRHFRIERRIFKFLCFVKSGTGLETKAGWSSHVVVELGRRDSAFV